jgi:hypothetical protein
MKTYKVIFENNVPQGAQLMRSAYKDAVKLNKTDGHTFINWLIVEGDNEKEAIEIAGKVVKIVWGKVLE